MAQGIRHQVRWITNGRHLALENIDLNLICAPIAAQPEASYDEGVMAKSE